MGIIYRNGIPYAGTGKAARFFAATGDGAIDGSSATLKSIAEKAGDIYICQTAGTLYGISFKVGDAIIFKNAVVAGTAPTSSDFAVNKGTDSDTTYSAGTGLSLSGTTLNHSNSVTAGTASGDNSKTLSFGGTFTIPSVTYDSQGHITSSGTTTMTMPGNPNSDTKVTNTLSTTTKAYVTGTSSSTTNTGTQFFDTGVYLTSTAGELAATTFSGKLKGTIDSSTTATTQTQGNNSTKIATTAYVDTAISDLPSPMVFKGSLGTNGTITTLPTNGTATVGDTYKVITAGTYASQAAKVGDMFICDSKTSSANTWTYIPSADEPDGTVTSVKIKGVAPIAVDNETPITTSGTRQISHATSGATPGSYGDSAAQTPTYGDTFKVPYVTVNNTGHVTEISEHTVTIPVSDNIDTIPSAYCKTAANLQYKFASCTDYSLLNNSYVQVVLKNANTYSGQLYFAIEKDGLLNYKKIYINGTVSSSTNYTLPAGTYLVYCDGTNYYFRTDGKITGTGLVDTSNNEIYTNNTGTVTGTGTSSYLTKWSGTNSITNGPQLSSSISSQTQSTKFLRQDGTWSAPSYTSIPSNNVTGSGTSNKLAKWNGTNTITDGPGITDNSSATAVTSTDTNLITGRTLYYAGYTKNTGTVTGSSLTADNIITGNGSTAIKSSGKTIATSISAVDTAVPTSNAVKTYADSINALTALCSTAAATQTKVIDSVGPYTNFDSIPAGTTIHVMFENGNSASPIGLKIGSSTGKNIYPAYSFPEGTILSLTKTKSDSGSSTSTVWYVNDSTNYLTNRVNLQNYSNESGWYPVAITGSSTGSSLIGGNGKFSYQPSTGLLRVKGLEPEDTLTAMTISGGSNHTMSVSGEKGITITGATSSQGSGIKISDASSAGITIKATSSSSLFKIGGAGGVMITDTFSDGEPAGGVSVKTGTISGITGAVPTISAPNLRLQGTSNLMLQGVYSTWPTGSGTATHINSAGYIVKYSSSRRYKDKIDYDLNLNDYHEQLMELKPCTFEYKTQPDETQLGLIAEDVYEVNPDLTVCDDGLVDSFKDRDILTMLVIEAQQKDQIIQSLQSEIELLKQRLDNLES